MGKLARQNYTDLDVVVAKHGLDNIRDVLMRRLSAGDSPSAIAAEEFGLAAWVLRKLVESHFSEDVGLAYRARADDLEWEATNEIRNSTVETVGLSKLRSDYLLRLAGKLDRSKWGEKADGCSGGGGVSFTIVIGSTHPELEVSTADRVLENNG